MRAEPRHSSTNESGEDCLGMVDGADVDSHHVWNCTGRLNAQHRSEPANHLVSNTMAYFMGWTVDSGHWTPIIEIPSNIAQWTHPGILLRMVWDSMVLFPDV